MPELPEVETICRGLKGYIQGCRILSVDVRRRDLRRPIPPDLERRLKNGLIEDVWRRGKYVVWCCDDGTVCVVHLGMSGRLVVESRGYVARRHDHVLFDVEGGYRVIFHDPRRFGMIDLTRREDLLYYFAQRRLGLEPLSEDCTTVRLWDVLRCRRRCMKDVLLDQSLVVGIGNIYASEILFLAGISPLRFADTLSLREVDVLRQAMFEVLTRAITAGGTTLRDYVRVSGTLGFFQHELMVYGRRGLPCTRCGCDYERTGGIVRIVQGSRSTFYCPRQQH